eukprot:scaffold179444_cov19-Tisochrysis_lutea.AAC.1
MKCVTGSYCLLAGGEVLPVLPYLLPRRTHFLHCYGHELLAVLFPPLSSEAVTKSCLRPLFRRAVRPVLCEPYTQVLSCVQCARGKGDWEEEGKGLGWICWDLGPMSPYFLGTVCFVLLWRLLLRVGMFTMGFDLWPGRAWPLGLSVVLAKQNNCT